ncbi:hypothetical protein Ais01nite_77920 [Asanoa ishikariensis]|uniref:Uncharacterized protein n=1 Tax=Asanoa ishikariensis TaxID=137265 RepID=A0A1H3KQF6_9ACTN|nr:hypothetical protein [Asanoa ishikariensis]GIF69757.1 hypothetical protein Ais01nite_77920 [Asanoa ishikariensis]SDY54310.1 hypothetical protein SAMN05421684_0274 [Asanoa ishikariensis]
MLFQPPAEAAATTKPAATVRPRKSAADGEPAAPRVDESAAADKAETAPSVTDATPRPRKKAAPATERPVKKAAKKAAPVKRTPQANSGSGEAGDQTPAARTAKQVPVARPAVADQADVVKDPPPATTKAAKIPARREATTADEVPAPAPAKAAKRAPAKKAAPVPTASTNAPVPAPAPEQPAAVQETSAMSIETPARTEPAAPARTEPAAPANPDRSLRRLPELAAVAAAERLAPRAAEWARETRTIYPTASPDGLARLAQRRFTRKATATGAAVSFANGWSAAADLAGTGWVNAELIAHIAAAYGKRATAADILVLTGVHQDHTSAQAAIDGEPGHSASRAPITAAGRTATWAALKILTRWWPGLAAAGGAATASLNSERVAARAIQRFRAS